MAKSKLCLIDSLLKNCYKESLGKLKESQACMELDIYDGGRKYLLYSFDKQVVNLRTGLAIDLQPYFNSNAGVKSMCDYFLFCWEGGTLFVLLIELKRGAEQVMTQLDAGEQFANYLVNTLNRIEKKKYVPEIRKISVRDYHIIRKGTSMKPVEYDSKYFCTFEGATFHLLEFLK